ncbi:Uncharacterised protein [Chlamydia trachomatis]|nr:Uncharacterised protein [Chlamydia trachomatis]
MVWELAAYFEISVRLVSSIEAFSSKIFALVASTLVFASFSFCFAVSASCLVASTLVLASDISLSIRFKSSFS